jgi:molybdopterin-containing oxidoreductase family iron-sulfur binding subunit
MENKRKERLDWNAVCARLGSRGGRQYWQSLEELAETPEFQRFLEDEFPNRSTLLQMDRRQFVLMAGASLALAGLSGCRYLPPTRIVPYVKQPEELVPGQPLFYATAHTLQGYANGVLARSNDGRPTKLEGNPDHPGSLGACDAITQAAILTMYDPDRAQTIRNQGEISSWGAFVQAAHDALVRQKPTGGAGLRLLTETITSPTLAAQIRTLLAKYPSAKWHQYEPTGRDSVRLGARLAFGEDVHPVYHFDKADRILSLDADFLLSMPGHLRYAHDYAAKRRVHKDTKEMNRLYMAESVPTITGAMADHRLPMRASQVLPFAVAAAKALGVDTGAAPAAAENAAWIAAMAKDLQAHRGTSLVVAGDHQPPAVHALAHAMNAALGNVGSTVVYTEPVEASPTDQLASLRELIEDMRADRVQVLLILGGNPVYDAPGDLAFGDNLSKVPLRIHLGLHADETGERCHWQLPETHFLEMWGDARAYDGTVSIIQPLIEPIFDSHSVHELLEILMGRDRTGYDILHDYWSQQRPSANFENDWQKILHDGVIPGTAAPAKTVALKPDLAASLPTQAPQTLGLEIMFRPDPTIWDGRFANNGWLQELPKPLTKLVWDNTAQMSIMTAKQLGVESEDVVELNYKGRKVEAAVWLVPGHPDGCVTVHLGYGRTRAGRIAEGTGFNACALRTSDALWFGPGLNVRRTGGHYHLATTQFHHTMEEREPIRPATLEEFLRQPGFPTEEERRLERLAEERHQGERPPISFYPAEQHQWPQNPDDKEEAFGAYAWAMSIDTNVCISCNACVTGCQAENNIPVVGKDQIMRGRDMQWIRIDRYYKVAISKEEVRDVRNGMRDLPNTAQTDLFNPEKIKTYFQPVPCMHCELAPCEPVCPVAATTHSKEGLNQMIYNRCVGTKYCSNNCPYKVRRFNFYKYTAGQPNPDALNGNYDSQVIRLSTNPDVTVRGRGVMEKCTYCVQRINQARIASKKEGREIQDGEIKTACQQACPTGAIVFGNINDKNSAVSRLKAEPHDYDLLADLGTKPRTSYLAKLSNPNPEIGME